MNNQYHNNNMTMNINMNFNNPNPNQGYENKNFICIIFSIFCVYIGIII